jgi:hypothetical protein
MSADVSNTVGKIYVHVHDNPHKVQHAFVRWNQGHDTSMSHFSTQQTCVSSCQGLSGLIGAGEVRIQPTQCPAGNVNIGRI